MAHLKIEVEGKVNGYDGYAVTVFHVKIILNVQSLSLKELTNS